MLDMVFPAFVHAVQVYYYYFTALCHYISGDPICVARHDRHERRAVTDITRMD